MVFRMELTSNELLDTLDMKYIAASTKGYTLPSSVYEISDINLMVNSLISNGLKVYIAYDDIRLK